MEERIQKIIAAAGLMSRRAAEQAILDGRVTVNGMQVRLGEKADPERDAILVDGRTVCAQTDLVYLMLNKPKGFVTTMRDEKGRKSVAELVEGVGTRVYPVGRLDINSEGLLLMTNDGELANRLMHPSGEIDKTYRTWVRGERIVEGVEVLERPLVIDGYTIRPAAVRLLKESDGEAVLDITIHEGRNRQVRKMCQQAGFTVMRLVRIREANLELGSLKQGQWRYLTERELKELFSVTGGDDDGTY